MKKGSNAFDNLDWLRDIFSDGSNTGSSGAKGSKNGKGAWDKAILVIFVAHLDGA